MSEQGCREQGRQNGRRAGCWCVEGAPAAWCVAATSLHGRASVPVSPQCCQRIVAAVRTAFDQPLVMREVMEGARAVVCLGC